jgi:ComF family protein
MGLQLSHLAATISAALIPGRCLNCDGLCPWSARPASDTGLSAYLCPPCDRRLVLMDGPLCTRCGGSFASDQGVNHICGACRGEDFAFQSARSAVRYDGAWRAVIHHYKYRGCEPLAKPLGQMLWTAFGRHWSMADVDVIVPVPLHRRRLRQRGFNQADLLLRQWPRLAARQGAPFDKRRIMSSALLRQRHTAPQAGLNRKARQANLRHAFALGTGNIVGQRVLLVDDVFTTGATVHACAQVLRRGGATSVMVLTLARAQQ